MKNWRCKIGFHRYEVIGNQSTKGVVGGFSMTTLVREVSKCGRCGKVKFYGYDIATDAHLDETLDWKPKFKIYENYACPDEMITKLEDRQEVLKGEFHKIISQPISDDSIKEAETKGAEIISESIDNGIMLDILNWGNDSKLSDAALKFKKSKEE